ncbi:MAG: hypothetical protein KA746_05780 [Pyrinomonadaceae bacterium]|nr:hypothetical protein [Pyrinomonadaceae bacterium]MBP6212590.1 hypothetical protein [Pyrinomonadaceae bacterium]
MKPHEKEDNSNQVEELPDSWWYRVYAAVIISLVLVLAALSLFSKYFSS